MKFHKFVVTAPAAFAVLGWLGLDASKANAQQFAPTQPASLVLGQGEFQGTAGNWPLGPGVVNVNDKGLNSERVKVAVDPATGKVFVSDEYNRRVLRYGSPEALTNGSPAEAVFGQPNFTSVNVYTVPATRTASTLANPRGLWVDGAGNLWVADGDDRRVLRYPNAATAPSFSAAVQTFGAGFSASAGTVVPTLANLGGGNLGVVVDAAGNLYIADELNHRVVIHLNAASKGNQPEANIILGQANATSKEPAGSATDLSKLYFPVGLAVTADGTLYVSDRRGRVLRWDAAATRATGTPADAYLHAALSVPFRDPNLPPPNVQSVHGLAWQAATETLFVSIEGTVLWYKNPETLPPAALAIGNFGASNSIPSPISPNGAEDYQRLFGGGGVAVAPNGSMWLGDLNRVLRVDALTGTPPQVKIAGKKKLVTGKKTVRLRGTASAEAGLARIEYKTIGKFQPVAGMGAWSLIVKPSAIKRRTVVRVRAVDGAGRSSAVQRVVIVRKFF